MSNISADALLLLKKLEGAAPTNQGIRYIETSDYSSGALDELEQLGLAWLGLIGTSQVFATALQAIVTLEGLAVLKQNTKIGRIRQFFKGTPTLIWGAIVGVVLTPIVVYFFI